MMEKRKVFLCTFSLIVLTMFSLFISAALVSAAQCQLSVNLINQDPYPATPGDYVKLVFQVDGLSNADCGTITLELKNQYPIEFDPGANPVYTAQAGSYQRTYGNFLTVPFKVRVNSGAIDGDSPIETYLSHSATGAEINDFNISIKDLRADFEVYPKNYDIKTDILTLEILNIGKTDTKAVTITLPPQDNIVVKGPNKNVAGDLDSNEYTTADFEVSGVGGKVQMTIDYTDEVNVRRTLEKTIEFDPNYFKGRKADAPKTSMWTYLIIIAILAVVVWWIYKKYRTHQLKKIFSK